MVWASGQILKEPLCSNRFCPVVLFHCRTWTLVLFFCWWQMVHFHQISCSACAAAGMSHCIYRLSPVGFVRPSGTHQAKFNAQQLLKLGVYFCPRRQILVFFLVFLSVIDVATLVHFSVCVILLHQLSCNLSVDTCVKIRGKIWAGLKEVIGQSHLGSVPLVRRFSVSHTSLFICQCSRMQDFSCVHSIWPHWDGFYPPLIGRRTSH